MSKRIALTADSVTVEESVTKKKSEPKSYWAVTLHESAKPPYPRGRRKIPVRFIVNSIIGMRHDHEPMKNEVLKGDEAV